MRWLTYLLGIAADEGALPMVESIKFVACATARQIDSKLLFLSHEWLYEEEVVV